MLQSAGYSKLGEEETSGLEIVWFGSLADKVTGAVSENLSFQINLSS